jgi:hypothetical protein
VLAIPSAIGSVCKSVSRVRVEDCTNICESQQSCMIGFEPRKARTWNVRQLLQLAVCSVLSKAILDQG